MTDQTTPEYLPLDQSALLAKVTPETILQYEKFGLLSSKLEGDKKFYSKRDLSSVFRSTMSSSSGSYVSGSENSAQTKIQTTEKSVASEQINPTQSQPQMNSLKAETSTEKSIPEQSASSLNSQIETSFQSNSGTTSSAPSARIESSYELLQLMGSLKDQIQMLKDERDWLRTRVEKLETRSSRDQVLLLSESRTVRSLVQSRKGLLSRALPWFKSKNS
jgi:DNA-binding transcriptional MerR regulator